MAIILIKYKPMYEVKISDIEVGYVQSKKAFNESIEEYIGNYKAKNVLKAELQEEPQYELKLVEKKQNSNEEEVIIALQKDIKIIYQYYQIALEDEIIESVDTKEEAEQIIQEIGSEKFSIIEKTTENIEEVSTDTVEKAKGSVLKKANELEPTIANVNGIKISTLPITGIITSRYGVSSSIRKSTHTGLDIATSIGTPIKAVASGTVTCAAYSGAYGYLVKIDHGNEVETWYAHTNKMYVKQGQKVKSGDVIAAVGSTGNSTGPHLHLEVRINGVHVNPQKYLYK